MKILRKEVKLASHGDMIDLIDNVLKTALNITDDELDYMLEVATDEEVEAITLMIGSVKLDGEVNLTTFDQRRKALEIRNKYLAEYESKHN